MNDRIAFQQNSEAAQLGPDNPWPGLLPFTEGDHSYFFGRESEAEELQSLVLRERLTVLYGMSGLGKSSLLQAGLFPRLRQKNILPIYVRFDFSARPDFVEQIEQAMVKDAAAANVEIPRPNSRETLWEYLHRSEATFWDKRNRPVIPLFVLDQFEELFTLGQANPVLSKAVDNLLTELSDLAEGRPPRALRTRLEGNPSEVVSYSFARHDYKISFSIREDFLPELDGLRSRMGDLAINRIRLRPMNGNAALLVVNQAPQLIDPPVAEQVVRFVAAAQPEQPLQSLEVDPALLSVVCRELNNKRQDHDEQKITEQLLEGNKDEVLNDFYQRGLSDLPPAARFFIEDRLLTVSGYRNSEALDDALSRGIPRDVIDILVGRRLLRIEDYHGVPRLELAHDRLAEPVRISRDRRKQADAQDYDRTALREAQERERRALADLRKSRMRAAIFAFAAAIAIAAAIWAFFEQRRANDQESKARKAQASAEQQTARADLATQDARNKAQQFEDAEKRAELGEANATEQSVKAEAEAAQLEQQKFELKASALRAMLIDQPAQSLNGVIELVGEDLGAQSYTNSPVLLPAVKKALKAAVDTAFERNVLSVHAAPVWVVTFLPDGKQIISGSFDGTLAFWDYSGKLTKRLYFGGHIDDLAVSPDGKRIVVANDSSVLLLDINGEQIIQPLRHERPVSAVAYSPDGAFFASAGQDKTIRFWDSSGKPVNQPIVTESELTALSLGRGIVVAGDNDGKVGVWETSGKVLTKPFLVQAGSHIISTRLSHNGKLIAASNSGNNLVSLWNLQGELIAMFKAHTDRVTDLAFSPDDSRIASASADHEIKIWDIEGHPLFELRGHENAIHSIAFSPDGRTLASAAGDTNFALEGKKDFTVRLWDAGILPVAEAKDSRGEEQFSVAFGANGGYLATAGNQVHLWSTNGRAIGGQPNGSYPPMTLALSPDGQYVAAAGSGGSIGTWNLRGKIVLSTIKAPAHDAPPVTSVAYSRDGALIGSSGADGVHSVDGVVRLWDRKGAPYKELKIPGQHVDQIAFSPTADLLAIAGTEGLIEVWDWITGKTIRAPIPDADHREEVFCLAFGHHGLLATGTQHGIVLWKNAGGHLVELVTLSRLWAPTTGVAFSQNDDELASVSADRSLRFWDLSNLQPDSAAMSNTDRLLGKPYQADDRYPEAVAFNPKAQTVATVGRDGTVRLWNADWQQWLHMACDRMQFHPLLSKSASQVCTRYAWSTLHESKSVADAAWSGDVEAVRKLIAEGYDPNQRDSSGLTPLAVAAWTGRLDIAEVLLAAHANINLADKEGNVPLTYAVLSANEEMLGYLIGRGPSLNARNKSGATPLDIAQNAKLGPIENLLVDSGAKPDKLLGEVSKPDSYNPLPERFVPKDIDPETKAGIAYENGAGEQQSFELAAKHYRIAAEQGIAYAQFRLARLYYYGKGVPQSFAKDIEWLRKSAASNNSWGLRNLALEYVNGAGIASDPEEAFRLMLKSAQMGNPSAERAVGEYYRDGTGTTRDYEEAIRWLQLAASQGEKTATEIAWLVGSTQMKNRFADEEIAEWYQKAADEGSAAAKFRLGWLYESGSGVVQSSAEALRLYREAADAGDLGAQAQLATIYAGGLYGETRPVEAFTLFQQAAAKGNVKAMIGLGRLYEDGIGTDKSLDEARNWYEKAAKDSDQAKDLLSALELRTKSGMH